MSPRPLICAAAVGAALIGQSPAMAEPDDATPVTGVEVVASKPTPLSGVDIVARKPNPTPVSGVDIVAPKTTRVSEVNVTLPPCPEANKSPSSDIPPPTVVSSYPPKGAVVRPGLLVLRVTFDKPMTCVGLLAPHAPLPDPCPAPLREPMISRDKRTFLTVCMVGGNRHYGLWLNRFTSLGGRSVPPYELLFDTSDEAEIATVGEAVSQDTWLKVKVSTAP